MVFEVPQDGDLEDGCACTGDYLPRKDSGLRLPWTFSSSLSRWHVKKPSAKITPGSG